MSDTVRDSDTGRAAYSLITPRNARRSESQPSVERVFQGAAKPLLVHFATNSQLSKDELRELKQLFEKELKNRS